MSGERAYEDEQRYYDEQAKARQRACKDCYPDGHGVNSSMVPVRPRPVVRDSGGRCATHWREEKARRKARAHEARVRKVYGLAEGDYGRLYDAQRGTCYICQRATGARKKLAVDHDHKTGLARGLLCGPCNKILGHLRDDPVTAWRVYDYLTDPPAARLGIVAYHEEKRDE